MKKRNWKKNAALVLTVIMTATATGGIQQVNAKSTTVTGRHMKLYVSATNTSGWVDIYNRNTATSRYVQVYENAYNSKGQLVSKDYCDGVISSGGRTACQMGLKNVRKVIGTGKIYKGKTSAALIEKRTVSVNSR